LVPAEFAERLLATRGQVVGERRVVTILFSDVKGSTAMAEDLDPEEVLEIMNGAFGILIEPVARHEGTLARLMGDAILAFFGAPVSHEDDPERACHAALEIIEGAKAYAARLERERGILGFNVRVGIHTGLVVVGEVGSDLRVEYTAMGDAVNLAARMEGAAEPGTVLITEDTQKLIAPLFETRALQSIRVKGKREPVQVYVVQRARPRAFYRPTRGVEGVETRMIGREAELKHLQDAFHTAIEDFECRMVTITGEAGVGKSRLLFEFERWLDLLPEDIRRFKGRATLEMQSVPYGLIRDLLSFRFHIQDSDPPTTVQEKLEAGIGEALGESQRTQMRAHFIGQLLGFDLSASSHLQAALGDARQLHDRALAYLEEFLRATATQTPTLLLLEDIHWSDDSSLDALNRLALGMPRQRLLVICLARPPLFQRRPNWGEGQAFHTRLDLHPLSRWDSRRLVAEILQRAEEVPLALRDLVVSGAEGNPFYVEELIKMLIEDGVIVTGHLHWRVRSTHLTAIHVPPTLTGVLQARLDSLPLQERTVLQQASVVGRVFWDSAVVRIGQSVNGRLRDEEILNPLSALRGREMVFRRETSAFTATQEYIFKHAILREVTYESVLRRVRRGYHGLVAEWLIAQSRERSGEYMGLIADHLELAGEAERAITYLRQAGQHAARRFANEEAIAYIQRAIALLGRSPMDESQEAWTGEVAVQLYEHLGDTLHRTGREDEARGAYEDALVHLPHCDEIERSQLHRKMGNTLRSRTRYAEALQAYGKAQSALGPESAESLPEWWQAWLQIQLEKMWVHYWLAQWPEIAQLAEEAQSVVERYGTRAQRVNLLLSVASIHFRRDRYAVSEDTLALCREALDISQEASDVGNIAWARFMLGFGLLWHGDIQEAEAHMQVALKLAQRRGDLVHQSRCLTYLTVSSRKRGQVEDVREYVARSLAVAKEAQMLDYVGTANANLAWLAWREGDLSEAQEKGQSALALWEPLSLTYAWQWTALWPLIGVALAQDRVPEAVDHTRALLDPLQERLPDALAAVVHEAIGAWEQAQVETARNHLSQAIALAGEMGYV
jgi:class 3 adenylate cyclase/tetratricopeptide (TPR) repeat protein